ncbi:MAG: hypothetical protein FWK01_18270 [Pantanalinema sp. GBBB05]|nr:hypothetical protein [Pantanalinema sp. GBBB05]
MFDANPDQPKVLIIYERSGMGHEVMATILAEQILPNAEVEIVKSTITELLQDPFSEWLTKTWVAAWNFFMRHNWSNVADALINYGMRLLLLPIGEVSAVKAVHQALDQLAPDILICTADTAGKCLGSWAKAQQIPFFLIITDLSIFIDLVSPDAIHLCYFPETVTAIHSFPLTLTYWSSELNRSSSLFSKLQFIGRYLHDFVIHYAQNRIYRNIDRNYPSQNQVACQVIGPLREAKHFTPRNQKTLRRQFDLPPTATCILVISGSLGGHFCIKSLKALQQLTFGDGVVIVACGQDQPLRTKVDRLAAQTPNCQVRSLGFVDNLHEWMSAVDVVLARPSAGVLLEALLARTPLLLPNHAAANDRGAVSFVENHQLGECFRNWQDLQLKLDRLLNEKAHYQRRIDALLKNYPSTFEAQRIHLRQILLNSLRR